MRRREFYWSFYNLKTKKRLDDLKTDQLEVAYEIIPEVQHSDWVVWKDGFDAWKTFVDFPSLVVSLRKQPVRAQELPPAPKEQVDLEKTRLAVREDAEKTQIGNLKNKVSARETFEPKTKVVEVGRAGALAKVNTIDPANFDNQSVSLAIDAKFASEGRHGVRYQRRLPLLLQTEKEKLRFWTIDVSMSGIKIDGKLPKNLPRYFNVELKIADSTVQLICSTYRQDGQLIPDLLKIEFNDQADVLQHLLLAAG